jgi:hypothetical protein
VTNARVRQVLAEDSEDDKVFWIAKIMREARYEDVWKYVSLRRDVLPRWPKIEPQLGRWKDKWRFLVEGWQQRGLVQAQRAAARLRRGVLQRALGVLSDRRRCTRRLPPRSSLHR